VIIQCSSCQTRYHYDERRFAGAQKKKIRCTKCTTIFEIFNPELAHAAALAPSVEESGPLNSPILGADDFSLDTTMMGGGPRRRPVPVPPPLPPGLAVGAAGGAAVSTDVGVRPLQGGRSVPPPGRKLALPPGYRISLACLAGPDSGRIFEVDKPRVTLGRANADIVLTDGQCSRQHAAIEVADEQIFLQDLASTNGTFVGEKKVDRVELDNRTEFDVGATTLMLIKTRKDG
jgi:predicted Zn finger-like uncharacterized protein